MYKKRALCVAASVLQSAYSLEGTLVVSVSFSKLGLLPTKLRPLPLPENTHNDGAKQNGTAANLDDDLQEPTSKTSRIEIVKAAVEASKIPVEVKNTIMSTMSAVGAFYAWLGDHDEQYADDQCPAEILCMDDGTLMPLAMYLCEGSR